MLSRDVGEQALRRSRDVGPDADEVGKVPSSSGRSVELRTITTGRLMIVASSCTPPESLTRSAASAARPRNSHSRAVPARRAAREVARACYSWTTAQRGDEGSTVGTPRPASSVRMVASRVGLSAFRAMDCRQHELGAVLQAVLLKQTQPLRSVGQHRQERLAQGASRDGNPVGPDAFVFEQCCVL